MSRSDNKCHTYKGLKFYAKNGCICLHDEEDGSFFVLTVREFLQRAKALSEEVEKLRKLAAANPLKLRYAEERLELQRAIDNMLECCKEAKNQGDRHDPKVAAWFARHRPHARGRSRRGVRYASALPGPLPLGQDVGRYATPDFAVKPGIATPAKPKLILPGE